MRQVERSYSQFITGELSSGSEKLDSTACTRRAVAAVVVVLTHQAPSDRFLFGEIKLPWVQCRIT